MTDRYGRLTAKERRSHALYRLSNVTDPSICPDAKLTGIAGAVRICRLAGCQWEEMASISGLSVARLEQLKEM